MLRRAVCSDGARTRDVRRQEPTRGATPVTADTPRARGAVVRTVTFLGSERDTCERLRALSNCILQVAMVFTLQCASRSICLIEGASRVVDFERTRVSRLSKATQNMCGVAYVLVLVENLIWTELPLAAL